MTDECPLNDAEKLLLKAADILDKRGLAKCTQLDERTGCMCLHGAISIAAYGKPYNSTESAAKPSLRKLQSFMAAKFGTRNAEMDPVGYSLADWNNRDARTKEEVVKALQDAVFAGHEGFEA